MSVFKSLEKSLDEIFDKNAPDLPAGLKKWIVQYLPYINLVLGVITVIAAWSLWNAAHTVNTLVDYANNLSAIYGGEQISTNRLTFTVWLALGVLAVEAVLYIAAFPGTKARKKSGWDLLFYALLINVAYGIVVAFTDYGGFGSLLGSLIGSAVGAYFLFQIRPSYAAGGKPVKTAKKATPAKK
jgi:hypothetical protein